MGCVLRLSRDIWQVVRGHLSGSRDERMVYLLARAGRWVDPWTGPVTDLLVTVAIPVPDAALTVQNGVRVEIAGWLTREVLVACYETGMSLVDVHSHPFSADEVEFSAFDVANMGQTHGAFLDRMPGEPAAVAASLVVGRSSVAGAYTDPDSRRLHALERMVLLGDEFAEVPLCPR